MYFYLKVQNSLLLVVFWRTTSIFVPVNMSKWLNGLCYVEIELRSGILEVENLQKELFLHDPMTLCYEVRIKSHIG